jgi:hypothetical protein
LFDNRNVNPAYKKEWAKRLTEAGTFFKHARADPDASIDFNPQINEMFLLFSIFAIREMKERLAPEERAFTHWIFVNRPEILFEWAYDGVPVESIEELRGVSRKQFLKSALSATESKNHLIEKRARQPIPSNRRPNHDRSWFPTQCI